MTNLFEQAISCDDGDQVAKIIQHALGIESDYVLNCTFPKDWPTDRGGACSHHRWLDPTLDPTA